MIRNYTLDYWLDDGWYVGKLREVPGVCSQGESLADLEINIREAYKLMMDDTISDEREEIFSKELGVEV